MNMYDLILRKREGGTIDTKEMYDMIVDYTNGRIPDYQMSAFLMAVYFKGLSDPETLDMTTAMAYSGEVLDLSDVGGVTADKHSTGGVGDKTSLVLAPLVASCGIKVAKMSGRGLGHTGGTIDKLESIPGFHTELSMDEFKDNVRNHGIALMGQSAKIAPADKLLYALRDVTATVDNMSLIAASIMSKKIAAGTDLIVLDVKTGSGAFMKKYEDSMELASKMAWLGKRAGKKVEYVISDMDQPLGNMVGNALEVKEAIDTLNGKGPDDLKQLCITLGGLMLTGTGFAKDMDEAADMLNDAIDSGRAIGKFKEFIKAQGGLPEAIDNPEMLPESTLIEPLYATQSGYIKHMDCEKVGLACLALGGGRFTKESVIDLSVGIELKKKVSDEVKEGDVLAYLYANDKEKLEDAREKLMEVYEYSATPVEKPELIKFISRD